MCTQGIISHLRERFPETFKGTLLVEGLELLDEATVRVGLFPLLLRLHLRLPVLHAFVDRHQIRNDDGGGSRDAGL